MMSRMFTIVFIIFCGLAMTGNAMAEFYKWVDENGDTHITDSPVAQGNAKNKYKKQAGESSNTDGWIKCSETDWHGKAAVVEALRELDEWSNVKSDDILVRLTRTARAGAVVDDTYVARIKDTQITQLLTMRTTFHPTDKNLCRILSVRMEKKSRKR